MILPDSTLPNSRKDIDINGAIKPKKFGIKNRKTGSNIPLIVGINPVYFILALWNNIQEINAKDKVTE